VVLTRGGVCVRRTLLGALITGLLLAGLALNVLSELSPARANTGFRLPWRAGDSYLVTQSWDGTFSHICPGYNCYAYDFGLPEGTTLLAAADGVVEAAVGSNTTGGCSPTYNPQTNYVRIRHDDGSKTRYLHMRDVSVSVDDEVEQGDVIGHSGATGYACGAHLHFQRDAGGTSVEVYFEEYKDEQLAYGERVTSQNGPLPTRTATQPPATPGTPAGTPTITQAPTATPTPTITFTPTPVFPAGDAGCDGVADAIDALLVLQVVAGYPPSWCKVYADANRDGTVNAIDAILILQYAAGLIPALPA
jgi:hypothetical protein